MNKLARLRLDTLAHLETERVVDKYGYRERLIELRYVLWMNLRGLLGLVTMTAGSVLMALPMAPSEKGSLSQSTLMRWLNEAAETI